MLDLEVAIVDDQNGVDPKVNGDVDEIAVEGEGWGWGWGIKWYANTMY